MNNVKILDCTLRDGGRIIDCKFPNEEIYDISSRLAKAGIDIVEVGFLRDWHNVEYKGNSTFFTKVEQIKPFIDRKNNQSLYVAFVDYGMFDFDTLSPYDGSSIDGIRVGFTKKDYLESKNEIIRSLKIVQDRGYKLFVQGVNSLGYTDKELLEIVDMVNEIHPYSFGIVDTYGAMYVDDVRRIYDLIDHNMTDDICIDFHSHNNFQLSFSLAQEVIELSKGVRNIILDSTLDGMGKCAGNLNTELILDYLVRKRAYNYDFDEILDIIDEHMYSIKKNCTWGYSIPSVMSGIYKSHPNNVIYLTEKFRLATKDIKYIMSMIDPEMRQKYDYDNIQKLYQEYNHTKVEDKDTLDYFKTVFQNRKILILMPGKNLEIYNEKIDEFIKQNSPIIISANFITEKGNDADRYAFFGSEKRYKKNASLLNLERTIVVSNIEILNNEKYVVNYESVIERNNEDCDNTAIMLLHFLKRVGIMEMTIAGFDGYEKKKDNYFDQELFDEGRFEERYDSLTENMRLMLKEYSQCLHRKDDIHFLTPSIYESIFAGD